MAGLIATMIMMVLPQAAIVMTDGRGDASLGETPPSAIQEEGVSPPRCGDSGTDPHYYFTDTPKEGPNSFGPAAEGEGAKELIDELIERLCGDGEHAGDPVLFAAIQASIDPNVDPNVELERQEWRFLLNELVEQIIKAETYVTSKVTGDTTMMMVDGDSEQPLVEATPYDPEKGGTFLVLTLQDSTEAVTVLTLRVDCGYQPVW